MLGIGNNKIVKSMVFVCILMQIVAFMPHHHHSGSKIACIDYSHLFERSGDLCEGHCDGDHEHEDNPIVSCSSHNLVVVEPQRQQTEMEVVEISLPESALDVVAFIGVLKIKELEILHIFRRSCSGTDNTFCHLRDYISVAIPPRAPDFTA